MKKRSYIGILGSGKIALEYSKILKEYKREIYACSSSSPKSKSWLKFKETNRKTKYMTNDEILKCKKCTHIISCLPYFIQEKLFKKLISSDKKILIEKPFGFSSFKYKLLISKHRNKLKNKYLAFNRRYYSTVNTLLKIIKSRKIKFVEIKISENFDKKTFKKNKLFKKYLPYYGSSSHIIDLIFFLFKKFNIVKKYNFNDNDEYFKSVFVILKTYKNFPIFLNIQKNLPLKNGITVYLCNNSIYSLTPIEKLVCYKGYKIRGETFKKKYLKYQQNKVYEIDEKGKYRPGIEKSVIKFVTNKKDKTNFKDYYNYLLFYEKLFKIK